MDELSAHIEDGEYTIFVIDADALDDGTIRLEITITAGAYKGEVVAVRAAHLTADPIALMGLPGTLHVTNGTPRVEIDS